METNGWQTLGEGTWFKEYPLKLLGANMNRNVTAFLLEEGDLLVHSTGPFTEDDRDFLQSLGNRIHFLEATRLHDTFTQSAMEAFPESKVYAPQGFPLTHQRIGKIDELQELLGEQATFIPIDGMPRVNEVEVFIPGRKTLVLGDLLFNFGPEASRFTLGFLRATAGLKEFPGMSRLFRMMIRDKSAFQQSLERLRCLDFETLVFGHGSPILEGAKASFVRTLFPEALQSS